MKVLSLLFVPLTLFNKYLSSHDLMFSVSLHVRRHFRNCKVSQLSQQTLYRGRSRQLLVPEINFVFSRYSRLPQSFSDCGKKRQSLRIYQHCDDHNITVKAPLILSEFEIFS